MKVLAIALAAGAASLAAAHAADSAVDDSVGADGIEDGRSGGGSLGPQDPARAAPGGHDDEGGGKLSIGNRSTSGSSATSSPASKAGSRCGPTQMQAGTSAAKHRRAEQSRDL